MDRGAWQATVHGVKKSWTKLNMNTYMYSCPNSYIFLELYLFLLGCPICLQVAIVNFMTFLYLCNISSYFSSFISYFVFGGSFVVVLDEPG